MKIVVEVDILYCFDFNVLIMNRCMVWNNIICWYKVDGDGIILVLIIVLN